MKYVLSNHMLEMEANFRVLYAFEPRNKRQESPVMNSRSLWAFASYGPFHNLYTMSLTHSTTQQHVHLPLILSSKPSSLSVYASGLAELQALPQWWDSALSSWWEVTPNKLPLPSLLFRSRPPHRAPSWLPRAPSLSRFAFVALATALSWSRAFP